MEQHSFADIVLIIGGIFLLFYAHEFVHFFVAKWLEFRVPVFGFGVPIGKHFVVAKLWNTEFRLHFLLLGSYVSIPNLESQPLSSKPANLQERVQPLWKKIAVIVSGSLGYLLVSWLVLFSGAMMNGLPNEVASHSSIVTSAAGAATATTEQRAVINGFRGAAFEEMVPATTRSLLDMVSRATNPDLIWLTQVIAGTQKPSPNERTAHILGCSTIFGISDEISLHDKRLLPIFFARIGTEFAVVNLLPIPGLDGWHLLAVVYSSLVRKRLSGNLAKVFQFVRGVLMALGLVIFLPACGLDRRPEDGGIQHD